MGNRTTLRVPNKACFWCSWTKLHGQVQQIFFQLFSTKRTLVNRVMCCNMHWLLSQVKYRPIKFDNLNKWLFLKYCQVKFVYWLYLPWDSFNITCKSYLFNIFMSRHCSIDFEIVLKAGFSNFVVFYYVPISYRFYISLDTAIWFPNCFDDMPFP